MTSRKSSGSIPVESAVDANKGRAVGDRSADPVCQKCTDPHGCPGRRDSREHQGVELDDAGAARRGRRADCRPCLDIPGALTMSFIPRFSLCGPATVVLEGEIE